MGFAFSVEAEGSKIFCLKEVTKKHHKATKAELLVSIMELMNSREQWSVGSIRASECQDEINFFLNRLFGGEELIIEANMDRVETLHGDLRASEENARRWKTQYDDAEARAGKMASYAEDLKERLAATEKERALLIKLLAKAEGVK